MSDALNYEINALKSESEIDYKCDCCKSLFSEWTRSYDCYCNDGIREDFEGNENVCFSCKGSGVQNHREIDLCRECYRKKHLEEENEYGWMERVD